MGRPALTQADILTALKTHHTLSPAELQEQLGVNKTSIYRALEKLISEGKICKHLFGNDRVLYELRDHHHDHLVCEKCGSIEAIKCVTKVPKNITDFTVSHHHTTFFGACKKCLDS